MLKHQRKASISAMMICALFATVLFASMPARSADAPKPSALAEKYKPRTEMKSGLHVAYLAGTPYELGYQQGTLMKDEIQQVYKIYLQDLVYKDWIKKYAILKGQTDAYSNPAKTLSKFSKKNEKYIPAEYIEEMKGLADGSGLSYDEVLNMTAHVDYFAILFCSTFVVADKASKDGKLVEARNLDWASGAAKELDPFSTLFVVHPDKGHSYVSIIYPGIVGALTAVNDQKLTVELNFSMAKKNGTEGFPALLIVKQLAQNASSIDEAEKLLRGMKRIAGYNIMVTDGKTNKARLIEITESTVGTADLSPEGAVITTNHFVTKELSGANVDSSRFSEAPTGDRYDRLAQLIKDNYGKIDENIARSMIHDKTVKVKGTVQTIIFRPTEELIWVWPRGTADDNWIPFNVKELLK